MQTRMRSPAAHGPGMARACMWVSSCSSTRSAVRRSASSRKRRQIGRREKVLERALGLLGDVDLALLQALDQIVGREIDELDRVGAVEHRSGTVSRTRTCVICATTSLRLSMCWILTVV